jgi:uncharacterized protein (TIGR00251 family)
MDAAWLRVVAGAVEVRVRVVPRSSRSRIAGVIGDRLKLQVTSPPVDGEANLAVLELLAKSAGLPVRAATLAAGTTGRSKTVRLETGDTTATVERLEALAAAAR